MLLPTPYTLHFESDGAGTPVVLLHGSLCDARYWRWQLPELAKNRKVIAPSLVGYWPELQLDAFSVVTQAEHVQRLLRQEIGSQPYHLVGHSRGTQVAMYLASIDHEHLLSLCLADPSFIENETEYQLPHYLQEALIHIKEGDPETGLAHFIDAVNGEGTWKKMVRWFKTMVQDNASTLIPQSTERLPKFNLELLAQQLQNCSLLLITGQYSPERYKQAVQRLYTHFPQAHRLTITRAAHGMNLANPTAFNQSLERFFTAVENKKAEPVLGSA